MLVQPGKTIGMIGGGQLGRMLTREARRTGYRVVVYTDEYPPSPAGQLADREINAPYYDPDATAAFIREIDVATLEFENIPPDFLAAVEQRVPVYPSRHALAICQNREKEKTFLREKGLPHAEFRVADSAESLQTAVDDLGTPCVLKTAAFGYDGKGQHKIECAGEFGSGMEGVRRQPGDRRNVGFLPTGSLRRLRAVAGRRPGPLSPSPRISTSTTSSIPPSFRRGDATNGSRSRQGNLLRVLPRHSNTSARFAWKCS